MSLSFMSGTSRSWWGPKLLNWEDQVINQVCPTSLTFDSDHNFSSSCPIFDLGGDVVFSFDVNNIYFSSTTRTFDEDFFLSSLITAVSMFQPATIISSGGLN